jgi:hypothetical protein
MMAHAIRQGDKFKSLYGWTMDARGALQFRSASEAEQYVRENGVRDAKVEAVTEPLPPGIEGTYDPARMPRRG